MAIGFRAIPVGMIPIAENGRMRGVEREAQAGHSAPVQDRSDPADQQKNLYERSLVLHYGGLVIKAEKSDEVDTLQLLASGMTTREIAEMCDISTRMVSLRLQTLRCLLNARNNVHLVAIATALGIIDPPTRH